VILASDRSKATAAGASLVLVVAAFAYLAPGLVHGIEGALLDASLRARGPLEPSPRIAAVDIDEAAVQRFGRFPFDRRVFARGLEALEAAGAAVVFVDIVFSEHAPEAQDSLLEEAIRSDTMAVVLGHIVYTDAPRPDEPVRATSAAVLRAFREHEPAVATSLDPGARRVWPGYQVQPPLEAFQAAAAGSGFLNLDADAGGVVRRASLLIDHEGELLASATLTAATLLELGGAGEGSPLFVGGTARTPSLAHASGTVELDPRGSALLNYPGPASVFPTLGLAALIETHEAGRTPELKEMFEGRLVVLGPSAVGIWDTRDTPYEASAPAYLVHAAAMDNLLEGRFLQRPAWMLLAEWLFLLVAGLATAVVAGRGRVWVGLVVGVGLTIAPFAAARVLLVTADLWMRPMFAAAGVAGALVATGVVRLNLEAMRRAAEQRRRSEVMALFGQYVSPALVKQMVDEPGSVALGGTRRRITMMFSDIRGFTTFSEGFAPEELATFLSGYLDRMSRCIVDAGGMVDKYLGDGIMALFGAPLPDARHAHGACTAALAKMAALDRFNAEVIAAGRVTHPLAIGIGLNTGEAAVGNMGSELRFDYTAIGDEVNLAARLEGLTKQYGVAILISEAVRDDVGDAFVVRELDLVAVKGRSAPVRIFELLGPAGTAVPRTVSGYERALVMYRERRWADAEEMCSKILEAADDGPTRFLLDRIRSLRMMGAPEGWDAVHRFDSK